MPSPLFQKQSILPHIPAALPAQENQHSPINECGIVRNDSLGKCRTVTIFTIKRKESNCRSSSES